ncbi:hypothetical protein SAMN05216223_12751 [Actinacidiphila yanglinensis]|uniref:Uncharacterized protein n=1 Tax=Actinacidiphila yanglinensis TaxID=310779 RepID=A0A1H6E7H4_9ACTN|nr:hypothetical protein SAMN05216223_12751 [Actinacidiphila yanglinensis]
MHVRCSGPTARLRSLGAVLIFDRPLPNLRLKNSVEAIRWPWSRSRQARSYRGPGDKSLTDRSWCQVADQAFQMVRQVLVPPQLADPLDGKAPVLGETRGRWGREDRYACPCAATRALSSSVPRASGMNVCSRPSVHVLGSRPGSSRDALLLVAPAPGRRHAEADGGLLGLPVDPGEPVFGAAHPPSPVAEGARRAPGPAGAPPAAATGRGSADTRKTPRTAAQNAPPRRATLAPTAPDSLTKPSGAADHRAL